MKKSMRKIAAFGLLCAVGAGVLGGCGGSSSESKESKEVNLICWTEYIPQETLDGFEEETGIKVNVTYYTSQDEMLAKVTSSSKDTYDVIMDGTQYYNAFIEQGIIEEIDESKLENIGNIDPAYRVSEADPEGKYGIPFMGAGAVIAVNTDVIKDDIRTYQDLLNPEYKDSMVVIEDARAVVGMAAMSQGYGINDTSDEALEAAKAYLEELKPNIHAYNGDSPKTLMLNGECSIGLIYAAECALAMEENPAIVGVWPEGGVYFGFDELSIAKEGKNKENAYKLIDYILDAENSAYISTVFPYLNPNTAAYEYLGEEYTSNPIKVMPDEVKERVQYLADIGEDSSKIVDIMNGLKD
ncbi:MAG: spermidine/putrescine ABC transporter substrate-binding protein [Clostridiales bacterium]|nr:spermidine/putrescine ABC transporter substrate-binding protein [Clostridiales bacterium]